MSYTARIATLSLLFQFAKTMATKSENLAVSGKVPPFKAIAKKIIFPIALGMGSDPTNGVHTPTLGLLPNARITRSMAEGLHVSLNPFPFPECRTLNSFNDSGPCPPNTCCCADLLGHWDLARFVLAQHYFRVPINREGRESPNTHGTAGDASIGRQQLF